MTKTYWPESNKKQVKNATNVDEERLMKNESPAISKESQISDRKVVTRRQLKKTEQTRQGNPQKSKLQKSETVKKKETGAVMDKRKQRGDQNVLARKSNKNQVKNATKVNEERWMKNKSWNESLAISKEFQISDQQVVTRKHHKGNPKNWPRSAKGQNHKDMESGKWEADRNPVETTYQQSAMLVSYHRSKCIDQRKNHKKPHTFGKTSKKVDIIRSGKNQRWKSELKRIDEKTIISNQWSKISESKHHKNINKLDKIHQKGQSNTDKESVRVELGEIQLKRVIGNRKRGSNQSSRSSP